MAEALARKAARAKDKEKLGALRIGVRKVGDQRPVQDRS
jgi:hypothetical protein